MKIWKKGFLALAVYVVLIFISMPIEAKAEVTGEVFTYEDPNGTLQSMINQDLAEEPYNQTGSYNYNVVKNLKITGKVSDADLNFIKSKSDILEKVDIRGIKGADDKDVVFPKQMFDHMYFPSLKAIYLPENVNISQGMFKDCQSLKTLSIGDSPAVEGVIDLRGAKSFGKESFYGCLGIETLYLPENVEIPDHMFNYCGKLKTLSVGERKVVEGVVDLRGAKLFGVGSFVNCKSIGTVYLEDEVEIPDNIFSYCEMLKTLSVGEKEAVEGVVDLRGAKSFGKESFSSCSAIETVCLPDEVNTSERMFWLCTGLKTLSIGESPAIKGVIDLRDANLFAKGLFRQCTSVGMVYLPKEVIIPEGIFSGCSGLKTLSVGESKAVEGVIDLIVLVQQ